MQMVRRLPGTLGLCGGDAFNPMVTSEPKDHGQWSYDMIDHNLDACLDQTRDTSPISIEYPPSKITGLTNFNQSRSNFAAR